MKYDRHNNWVYADRHAINMLVQNPVFI